MDPVSKVGVMSEGLFFCILLPRSKLSMTFKEIIFSGVGGKDTAIH